MKPIENIMTAGMEMLCADGSTRRCVPVLCQYIADMEEQWLLTCTIKPTCPKCYHRGREYEADDEGHDLENDWRPPQEGSCRTDSDALRDRIRYVDDTRILSRLGYHLDPPFSVRYPFGGILDSVGPDLLHQISKMFMDYLMVQWIYPLMEKTSPDGVSKSALRAEFDARFALMPTYSEGRSFRNGIFTEKHFWSVHDMKQMMKVVVGALVGICPPEGVRLVREYLHIHRLAHYSCHTEESLQWMESAINTLFRDLRRPGGDFVRHDIVTTDYRLPQKAHYFYHYVETVRAKGALPSYSTDRTEIFHKPLRSAYSRSNKNGDEAIQFILKENTIHSAFQSMIDQFDLPEVAEDGGNSAGDTMRNNNEYGDSNREDTAAAEGPAEGPAEGEDVPGRMRTYNWPKHSYQKMKASIAEEKFKVEGFKAEVQRYFRQQDPDDFDIDPLIYVANSIVVRYPSWFHSEEAVDGESNTRPPTEHFMPGDKRMISDRISASKVRHESVLVFCPGQVSQGRSNTMSRRKVAQMVLLFKVLKPSGWQYLAYVAWFHTKKTAADQSVSGMFLLSRSPKREVIAATAIERSVHLIPKFGSNIGENVFVKRELDHALMSRNEHAVLTGEESKSRLSDLIMDHYDEFWLNTWSDPHIYKFIF